MTLLPCPGSTPPAALGEASQEPGLLQMVMSSVESAKLDVAALKAKADARQEAASPGSDSEGAAMDPGVLAATMAAVQETASDVQAVLDRVKAAIQEAEEQPQAVPSPWVHHGERAVCGECCLPSRRICSVGVRGIDALLCAPAPCRIPLGVRQHPAAGHQLCRHAAAGRGGALDALHNGPFTWRRSGHAVRVRPVAQDVSDGQGCRLGWAPGGNELAH